LNELIASSTRSVKLRRNTVVDTTKDGLLWFEQIEQADIDLLREMVKLFWSA
jgi:hypothetical protein